MRRYCVYDVFTGRHLAGNPLAVVLDAEGLDEAAMQAIAREFNLSETTFVGPPQQAPHTAQVRIFTPAFELPFAGHPTVGTAIALAERDGMAVPAILVLEEKIGPVRCAVRREAGIGFAEFDLAVLPRQLPLAAEPEAVGAALGLDARQVGFENHVVSHWSAGVPYVAVPVSGLAAAAAARLDNAAWLDLCPRDGGGRPASAYVYCRETLDPDAAFHARMFVPGNPSYEDPATGSAAAAFVGAVVHFDRPVDGTARFVIEQGIEMGRPSQIRVEADVEGAGIRSARIGGQAVKIAEGTLAI